MQLLRAELQAQGQQQAAELERSVQALQQQVLQVQGQHKQALDQLAGLGESSHQVGRYISKATLIELQWHSKRARLACSTR